MTTKFFTLGVENLYIFEWGKNFVIAIIWASLIAQLINNPPAMQETPVRFLGGEDPL